MRALAAFRPASADGLTMDVGGLLAKRPSLAAVPFKSRLDTGTKLVTILDGLFGP